MPLQRAGVSASELVSIGEPSTLVICVNFGAGNNSIELRQSPSLHTRRSGKMCILCRAVMQAYLVLVSRRNRFASAMGAILVAQAEKLPRELFHG